MATILVVDDDRNFRALLEQELTDEGYQVRTAQSGQDALDEVEHQRPDVVSLDIMMPGMDGIETLGKLLAKDRGIRVVLLTAYSTYRENFLTWSADAYVVKSGDLTEYKAKLRELTDLRKTA